MAEVAMTRDELIEFVEKNLNPKDFGWVDPSDDDLHDGCIDQRFIGDHIADMTTKEILDHMMDPEGFVEEAANALGMTTRYVIDIATYHDDNRHEGAIRWCSDPLCSNY